MHTESIGKWMHDHTFGQDRVRSGERPTILVIVISALTMILEIRSAIEFH